jgi:Cytochrome c oxidase assembly protein PET191
MENSECGKRVAALQKKQTAESPSSSSEPNVSTSLLQRITFWASPPQPKTDVSLESRRDLPDPDHPTHVTLMDCFKDPIESDDCRAERNAYWMCKHSQLNMRTRIRGVRTY